MPIIFRPFIQTDPIPSMTASDASFPVFIGFRSVAAGVLLAGQPEPALPSPALTY